MNKNRSYKVRVVFDDIKQDEILLENLTYQSACEWFAFYTRAALELCLDRSIRVVNLFCGRKCLKFFQNRF